MPRKRLCESIHRARVVGLPRASLPGRGVGNCGRPDYHPRSQGVIIGPVVLALCACVQMLAAKNIFLLVSRALQQCTNLPSHNPPHVSFRLATDTAAGYAQRRSLARYSCCCCCCTQTMYESRLLRRATRSWLTYGAEVLLPCTPLGVQHVPQPTKKELECS